MKNKCNICGKTFEVERQRRHYCQECKDRIVSEYHDWLEDGARKHLDKCIVCGKPNHSEGNLVCGEKCKYYFFAVTKKYRKSNGMIQKKEPVFSEERHQKKPKRKKKALSKLDECIRDARELGMSYGEYVVKRYFERLKLGRKGKENE